MRVIWSQLQVSTLHDTVIVHVNSRQILSQLRSVLRRRSRNVEDHEGLSAIRAPLHMAVTCFNWLHRNAQVTRLGFGSAFTRIYFQAARQVAQRCFDLLPSQARAIHVDVLVNAYHSTFSDSTLSTLKMSSLAEFLYDFPRFTVFESREARSGTWILRTE